MNEGRLGQNNPSFAMVVTTGPVVPHELVERLTSLGLSTLERHLDGDTAAAVEQHDPALLILLVAHEQRPTGQLAEIMARNGRPLVALVDGDRRAWQALVAWLDAGADLAYFTADFVGLTVAGVAALLRRHRGLRGAHPSAARSEGPAVVQSGNLVIDLGRRRVTRGSGDIQLTRMEFRVLQVLVEHADTVCSITDIAIAVYERPLVPSSSAESIRTCVSRLRRKLEQDPLNPKVIASARGFGYVFQRSEAQADDGQRPITTRATL